MSFRMLVAYRALALNVAIFSSLAVMGVDAKRVQAETVGKGRPIQYLFGDYSIVENNLLFSWAKVQSKNEILEVGVTIPVKLFDNQPLLPGDGPAGAIATLVFPDVVRNLTNLNHFELHTQPDGHVSPPGSVNPEQNHVPHFDFHFYAIDEEEVWLIPATLPPPSPVPAELLPFGYVQPGPSVLQMGRHASPLTALLDPNPLSTVMIAGFTPAGDRMHFIEPMVSREFLLTRNDFQLAVPMPEAFGIMMLYPTKFVAKYDRIFDVYHFVFSDFVIVE